MVKMIVELYRAVIAIILLVGLVVLAGMITTSPTTETVLSALAAAAALVLAVGLSAAVIRAGDEVEALRDEITRSLRDGDAAARRERAPRPSILRSDKPTASSAHREIVERHQGTFITRQHGYFFVGDERFDTLRDAEAHIERQKARDPKS